MDKILCSILNDIDEGIVILNENLEISIWNKYMERITGICKDEAMNNNIYTVLTSLNINYFNKSIKAVLNKGSRVFFSAAMHKGMITNKESLNLKISRIENNGSKFLLLEFIDVTNQFVQINRLKKHVQELCTLNKKLKEKEKIIKNLAYYDKLTGVANRSLFYELAERFLDNAKRNSSLLGLMFIDIDKFKNINDTYGHEVGDKVIIQVANILKEAIRKNDIVARYGGDEFLVLLPNINNMNNYEVIVSRILNNKNKVLNLNEEGINISLSIGVSFYPKDGDTIDKLIVQADKAMYIAKKSDGMDCFSDCNLLQGGDFDE